jgi:hypothetical protein
MTLLFYFFSQHYIVHVAALHLLQSSHSQHCSNQSKHKRKPSQKYLLFWYRPFFISYHIITSNHWFKWRERDVGGMEWPIVHGFFITVFVFTFFLILFVFIFYCNFFQDMAFLCYHLITGDHYFLYLNFKKMN